MESLTPDVPLLIESTTENRRALNLRLDWLSQNGQPGDWSQQASLKLGRLLLNRRQYEKAEFALHHAIALNQNPTLTQEATQQLTTLSTDARSLITTGTEGNPPVRSGEWLSRGSLVTTPEGAVGPWTDLVVAFAEPNQLAAYHTADGRLLWETELRLLDESSQRAPSQESTLVIEKTNAPRSPFEARIVGQTLIINTASGLHAVGLPTGRRLWSVPMRIPVPATDHLGDTRLFDADERNVVLLADEHLIELRRGADGSLVWSRRSPDRNWHSVRLIGNTVVAFSDSTDHVEIVGLSTHDGIIKFKRTFLINEGFFDSRGLFDTMLCGALHGHIVGFRFDADSPAWQVKPDFDISDPYPVGESPLTFLHADPYLIAAHTGGAFVVLDPATGRTILSGNMLVSRETNSFLCKKVQVEGTVFYLAYEGPDAIVLDAYDLATGKNLWTRTDVGKPILPASPLLTSERGIALLYQSGGTGDPHRPEFLGDSDNALVWLDKRTGQIESPVVPLSLPGRGTVLMGKMVVAPKRIVLSTTQGIVVNEER